MCMSAQNAAGKSQTVSDESPAALKQIISNLEARIAELEPRNRQLEHDLKVREQAWKELHQRYERLKLDLKL